MLLIIILSLIILYLININYKKENFRILNKKEFLNLRKKTNICEKPFRATCNKEKIYSIMKSVEEKLDELEYDIYKQNKKFKFYDKEFMAYRKNRNLIKKDAEKAQQEAKSEMSDIIKKNG